MTVQTRVVLIPFWIAESLKRAGLKTSDCVDYQKVKNCVSTHDLLTFLAAQELTGTLIGTQNNPTGMWDLGFIWNEGMKALPEVERKNAATLYDASCAANYLEEVKARLFTPGSNGPDYSPTYEKPYITYDLAPGVVGVVIHPGFFTESPSKEQQLSLVEAVLKVLYVYNTAYHEVASTLWFKRFLQLLAPFGR